MKTPIIYAGSSITCLPTFGQSSLQQLLEEPVAFKKILIEPEYKNYIEAKQIRRTPKINRMALACTKDCLDQTGIDQLGAIIVGTGLGCLKSTENFLKVSITSKPDSLIPPTNFIQSGHNAISGQIALEYKNHGYNMTYAQKGLSFEQALMDAVLQIREGQQHVLVGAVDERTDLLEELVEQYDAPSEIRSQLSEGCSFFIVGDSETNGKIAVMETMVLKRESWKKVLTELLLKHNISMEENVREVFVGYGLSGKEIIGYEHVVYTDFCGRYFGSAAFGFHMAYDYLKALGSSNDWTLMLNFDDEKIMGLTMLKHV